MKARTPSAVIGLLALGTLLGLGVAHVAPRWGTTPIGQILANRDRYRDSVVTVAGNVTNRSNWPLRYKSYQIADDSVIIVIARDSLPLLGEELRVTGVVKIPMLFGIAFRPMLLEQRRSRRLFQ